MFGFSTFSQSPISALGNAQYSVVVTEGVTFSDSYTANNAITILITENFIPINSASTTYTFTVTTVENVSSNDDSLIGTAYIYTLSEGCSILESETISAGFSS